MAWGPEEWKALGNVLSGLGAIVSGLFTALGVAAAGWYFLFRRGRGYFVPNLVLSVDCERTRSEGAGPDWLAIRVTLKRPDRGMLALLAAEAHVVPSAGAKVVTLWGCKLVQSDEGALSIDWNHENGPNHMPPGEETQFAAAVRVPTGEACQVNVAIRAWQYGEWWGFGKPKIGQWQASAVSLPCAPNEALQRTGSAGR